MSIIMFEIPEDTAKWPTWLEHRMVGLDLGDLVAELTCALKDQPPTERESLDEICGAQMPQLLEHGFKKLSTSQIRLLFKQPELLLELQEQVLTEGGAYWDTVKLPAKEQAVIDSSTQRTLEVLKEKLSVVSKPTDSETFGSRVWGALALAAALLIAVGIWRNLPTNSSGGWGFEKDGLLTANVSSAKYLASLADAAGQWTNKRPTTTSALETRLKEFRRGCGVLIQAPHNQLAQADRQWLVGKCQEWASKIDGYIVELQNGSGTLEQVQKQADETINRLQQALRDRALQTV